MSLRTAQRLATERLQLLEMEAGLQRAALAATFASLEKRRALAWGGKVATWGFRLLATRNVRWLIAANVLSRLRRRRAK
jgi:hypothetical protein